MKVAVEHLRHQYRISTEGQEAVVRDHLGWVLEEENGGFVLPSSSIRVRIWWDMGSEEDGLDER